MNTVYFDQLSQTGVLKTNIYGDKYLYNLNRNSFDKISAGAVFEAEFKDALFKENALNIIIGTDSGLLPKYIDQQGIPSGTRFIFIEPDHVLEQLNQNQLLENLPPEIVCTTPTQWEQQANIFKINEYSYINGIKSFNAICAQQAILDEYAELSWQLSESLHILHFRYNTSIGCETFIVRQLENITENILPVTLLANAFEGKTVLILAGGPSLTEVFPWLIENRHKLVVFSVSRISRQLIAANIEPDFVFSVDPLEINIDVSKEMFLFNEETVLINAYHLQPVLLNQWQGRSLYMGPRLPWQSPLNITNMHGTGPTVTNSALSIAHYFGFSRILLAGFDLCFTKEGITHAQGSDEQLAGPKYDTAPVQVETYNGELRPTGEGYYAALLTLAKQAEIIAADHCEIINLSPIAAKVEHIKHKLPLEIELEALNPEAISGPKQRIPHHTAATLNKYYSAVLNELEKAEFQTQAIAKLAQKALNINQRMYSQNGIIENYKEKRELDEIEKQLKRKHRNHSTLVKKFGIRQFIKVTSPHDDDEWDAKKAQKLGDVYYQAYLSGATALSKHIKDAIVRTQSRCEEIANTPDFTKILSQWGHDKSYGRAPLWLKKHPEIAIAENTSLAFIRMQKQFRDLLENKNTVFKAKVARHSSLHLLKSKIKLLFKHKKTDELTSLKMGFINDQQHDNKEPYLLIIDAYLAELNNDKEIALNHYNNLINLEESPFLEEALLRISAISLEQQDQNNALLAMDCLAQLSPIYLPYKAELARIVGDYLLAIDSYNAFIEEFPEDTLSKLKLTALYIDIKVYDAAELMLDLILETAPELESATALKNELAVIKQTINTKVL